MEYTALARKAEDFQQPPSADLLAAYCRRMLGESPTSAREIGGGAFNNTFVITACDGHKYVIRVTPPHDHPLLFANERYLLRREYGLTPFLSSAGPLLARVIAADFTCQLANRDAVISEFIEGENWGDLWRNMPTSQNDMLFAQLGALMRRLNTVKGNRFGWASPGESFERWSDFILFTARGLLDDYSRFGVDDTESRQWLNTVEQGIAMLDEIKTPHLIHGDPWPNNILIRREGDCARIVGLLDHERGLWGDVMNEWVYCQIGYPPAYWQAYGDRPTGPSAEFRAHTYHGLINHQYILEGYRYHFDVEFVRPKLKGITEKMRQLL